MKRVIGILFCGLVACGGEATSDDPVLVVNNGGNVDNNGGNNSNNGGNNSGNNNQPTVRCADMCPTKAALCQVPSEYVDSVCSMFCAGGDDAERVSCIQSKGCDELVKAFERDPDSVCDASPPPPPDMGTNPPDMSSDACRLGERRCESELKGLRCERLPNTGLIVEVIDVCVDGFTTCDRGWCVSLRGGKEGAACNAKPECAKPLDCQDGYCCQVRGEICREDDNCCGDSVCSASEFGYKVCKPR